VLVLIIIIVCLVLSSCRKEVSMPLLSQFNAFQKTQEVIVQPEVKVQETEQTSISVKSSPPKPKPKPKKKKKQKPIEKTRSEQTFLHGDDLNLVKEDQDRSIHIVGY
jgi:hypothetical protein